MKLLKNVGLALFGFLVVAGLAVAAPALQRHTQMFTGGVFILKAGDVVSSDHKLTRSLAPALQTIDFASAAAGGAASSCVESSGITVTGATVGDVCGIGPNATAGALNGVFSCYVSAANTVKGKFCNTSNAAIDPASGSFGFRVTSNQ